MANGRAKWSEIWDSWVLVEHVWRTFDLAEFNVICGSFGALASFQKYNFQNAASSTLMMNHFKQTFIGVHCDSPRNRSFLEFRHLKFEKKKEKCFNIVA